LYAADSSLAEVERIAPRWGEPMVERANVLERLGALYMIPPLRDTARMKTLFERGIAEVDQALSLNGRNAAALESLGTLSHWYWLAMPLPMDSAQRVLARAERALKDAVMTDPNRPEAWSVLSGILYARADYAGAFLAANRAYRADTYLENSQEILSALSLTAYEINDDSASHHWCDELNRRFTRSWPAAYCQLNLLARDSGRGTPARIIARAWRIATDTAWTSAPEQRIEPHLEMLAAAVLARYGLRDSAEAVITRANAATSDPEIAPLEAQVRLLLHQDATASALLRKYFTDRPSHRVGVVRSRRFASLTDLQRQLAHVQVPPAVR
jgi:tetratricopeptide (TPR) repeat protein